MYECESVQCVSSLLQYLSVAVNRLCEAEISSSGHGIVGHLVLDSKGPASFVLDQMSRIPGRSMLWT